MQSTEQTTTSLEVRIHDSLETVAADEWNRLGGDQEPLLSHEFLIALERNGCLGDKFGWYPRHVIIRDCSGKLLGAMPMYIKTNSYGEFVFDWSWASAYERVGLAYFPKLVVSIPYNPIIGPRLLVDGDANTHAMKSALIAHAVQFAKAHGCTGVHWLFTTEEDTRELASHGLMLRLGCQYHWHNHDYTDFDHFLAGFRSEKRKKLRRERRRVQEQAIALKLVHGNEADEDHWRLVHHFYISTFDRKWGYPTLSLGFFKEIGRTLGERIVLVFAEHKGRTVACAANFRSNEALYGRFWGCDRHFHSLHFEACYYQGIEYCIRHGLKRFEPGAQGEHKIPRGFLPTRTWSAHWIAHDRFKCAIADFCRAEQATMEHQCEALMALSPYREDAFR